MPEPPGDAWKNAFQKVAAQGDAFEQPHPEDGNYYAFLSQVNLVATGTYDVLFELVNKKWMDNAIFAPPISIEAPAPVAPAVLYHIPSVSTQTIVATLGLASEEDLVEGSWFLVNVTESQNPDTLGESTAPAPAGYIFDPDAGPNG